MSCSSADDRTASNADGLVVDSQNLDAATGDLSFVVSDRAKSIHKVLSGLTWDIVCTLPSISSKVAPYE
jgi:hypothetical protein